MLFALAVLAQQCTTGACCVTEVEIARLELQSYLDPHLNRETAHGLAQLDVRREKRAGCEQLRDDALAGFQALHFVVPDVAAARADCEKADLSACGVMELKSLFRAGARISAAQGARLVPGSVERRWFDLLNAKQFSYAEAKVAALRDDGLRSFVLSMMLGGDPREWDIGDTAIVIIAARQADREGLRNEWTDEFSVLREYLLALSPMGFRRAFDLVNPTRVIVPGINAEYRAPMAGMSMAIYREHFEFELQMYLEEWYASHPEALPLSALRGANREKQLAEITLFREKRWRETDSAAPHPDLEVLRKRIESLGDAGRR